MNDNGERSRVDFGRLAIDALIVCFLFALFFVVHTVGSHFQLLDMVTLVNKLG
jgi:hypothetical protein